MMGSLLTRVLIMIGGYAYPAYKCYKCVEAVAKPDVDQLKFWCQYWIIIAIVNVFERLGDTFISWLPLYNEAKLAFIIYLWAPSTMGTTYVYSSFLKPLVATREGDIDRHLSELSARAGDIAFVYWQKGSKYAQSRMLDIFQYVASQTPIVQQAAQNGPETASPTPPSPPPASLLNHSSNGNDYLPSAPPLPFEDHQDLNGYQYHMDHHASLRAAAFSASSQVEMETSTVRRHSFGTSESTARRHSRHYR